MRRLTSSIISLFVLFWLAGCVGTASSEEQQPQQATANKAGLRVISLDFSGKRAYGFLKKQVEIGPRVPGTDQSNICRKFIKSELAPYCTGITEQPFKRVVNGRNYEFSNVVAYMNPDAPRLVILVAHYDTRPVADMDTPENYSTPIPGANDGASGVAALLELARMLHGKLPDDVGIIFLFTDGEDTGLSLNQMFVGAEHFASKMSQETKERVAFGVLLDMVGDANLNILPERHSEAVAPSIYNALLELQDMMGLTGFKTHGEYQVWDDHIPFIERGVKMYNVIDFDYPYWHTLQDTPDKCSAESLRVVGLCVGNLILNFAEGNFNV